MKTIATTLMALAMAAPSFAQCENSNKTTVVSGHVQAPKNIVETAVSAGSFQTLVAAVQAAGLDQALAGKGPFTVFAPSDDAFAKLPKSTLEALLKPEAKGTLTSILTYHVVSGAVGSDKVVKLNGATTLNGQRVNIRIDEGAVMLNGAKVIKTDIQCSNGVIHVIDSVILPNTNDIIDTAVEAGSFSTLATALKTAGLIEALKGDGPFTVFAPTDKAFAKLPKETIASLLQPENRQKLTDILKYHVVAGRVYAENAVAARNATTLQGSQVNIRINNGRLMVNDASVTATDLDTTNGVIHVIDSVILPN